MSTAGCAVRECAEFQARFFDRWNKDLFAGIIDYFRLDPETRAASLSRGERAGLCLALTLAPVPELLILDDPALGLDPVARRGLLEAMVYVTRRQDRTIFFSSHLLSDVERVADRIAVMDRGRLVASCSLDTFRDRIRRLVVEFPDTPPDLPAVPGLLDSIRTDRQVAVTLVDAADDAEDQFRRLGASRVEPVAIDLEEAFISYVGKRGNRRLLPGAIRRLIMPAIIWKEIRENLKWAILAMLAPSLVEAFMLRQMSGPYGTNGQTLLSNGFLALFAIVAGAAAALLGLLQSIPEIHRDQWPFLIHRPITASAIFRAKVVAGLILYLPALLLPVLGAAVWLAIPGHVASPFAWRTVLPVVAAILAGLAFYFAGMLTGIRQARWYASRAACRSSSPRFA